MNYIFARNPGIRYENTRHNVAEAFLFWLIQNGYCSLAKETGAYSVYNIRIKGRESLGFASNSYNINETYKLCEAIRNEYRISRFIIVLDDYTIELGKFRFKELYSGTNFSHNLFKWWIASGMKWNCGLLKIGIGENVGTDLCTYVLNRFKPCELEKLEGVFSDIVSDICSRP